MKRTILKLLAVCIALLVSVGSTIAYLTDTDADVNVMTLGRVEIDLIERERIDQTLSSSISNNLMDFQDDHPIIPGVYPTKEVTGNEVDFWPNSVNNAIDKIVSVTNTGNSAAYVRLWFAFEVTNDNSFFDKKLHLNKNNKEWQWDFLKEKDDSYTYLSLDGSRYVVAVATYPQELAVGTTTPVSLRQVLLDASATNKDLAVLGEKYSIFVVAQGVQASGFDDAVTALNAGFKAPSAATHPFGEMTEKDSSFMVDTKALRKALNENVPNAGGKTAIRSISFGRMSEYVHDVEKLTASSLSQAPSMQNIGMLLYNIAFAEENDAPLVYYKPGENEDGTQYYDVYILYEGTIKLPNDCDGLLANYENLNSFTTTNLDAKEVKKMENFFKGCTNLTKVTVPKGVTEIDESTFAGCESLEKVSIPGTVEKINENAFKDHKQDILFIVVEKSPAQNWVEGEDLSSTVVPEAPQKPDIPFTWRNDGISITVTGYTGKDTDVVIPDTIEGLPVAAVGMSSFYGNATLKSISIPDTVEVIDRKAFLGCKNLSEITIPANVYAINEGAFYDCSGLSSITIPKNVTTIGEMVVLGCSNLTGIHVDADNPRFVSKEGVLFSKDMKTLIACPGGKEGHYDVPNGVTAIGSEAFYACSKLTSIKLPDSLKELGAWAFHSSGIVSIDIPGRVKSIPQGAFSHCSNLEIVNILNGVARIANQVFENCNALASVTLPKSISSIVDSAFFNSPQVSVKVYSNSYAYIWCKQNKVKYELCDAGADHVCDLQPVDNYIPEDEYYHQHVYKCSGCAAPLYVREQHAFGFGSKCVCGATNKGEEHVACHFVETSKYINQGEKYHSQVFTCTICFTEVLSDQNHVFDDNGKCVCGAANTSGDNEHVCNMQSTEKYLIGTELQHIQISKCQGCGKEENKYEAHSFDETGTCICGATNAVAPAPDVTIIGHGVIQNATTVNFRTGPGGNYEVINQFAEGTEVELVEIPEVIDSKHWFKIRYEGTIGYVMAPFVKVVVTWDGNEGG